MSSLKKVRKTSDYYRDSQGQLWKVTKTGIKLMKNAKSSKRCLHCGYTKVDSLIHMDHHLCKGYGKAPWEKKEKKS